MDQPLILEFTTRQQADDCLIAVNQIAAGFWESQGYTVIEGRLIGKNVATGMDDLNAAQTITWDTVKESVTGTFYFQSLRSDPRFVDGMSQIPQEIFGYTEKTLPIDW